MPGAVPVQIIPTRQRQCSTLTASGLGYRVLRAAPGRKPRDGDAVLINYIGYFSADGRIFDEGYGSILPVDGVVAGFREGLKLSTKRSITRLCLPARLAYGVRGAGPVPPNADLVFQVELLDFRPAAEAELMRPKIRKPKK